MRGWLLELSPVFGRAVGGNPVADWVTALCIVLGGYLLARLAYTLTKTVLAQLATDTDNQLDDVLIELVEEPLVLVITLLGLRVALQALTFGPRGDAWVTMFWHISAALIGAWLVVRLIDGLVEAYLHPDANGEYSFDPVLLPLFETAAKLLIGAIGLIVGLTNAGYDLQAVLAGLTVGGIGVAFAARDTLANAIGGVGVMWSQPFRIGDTIAVDGHQGIVSEVNLRSTTLHDAHGHTVVVPNKTFNHRVVTNLESRTSTWLCDELRIDIATPFPVLRRVLERIHQTHSEHPLVERAWTGLAGVEKGAYVAQIWVAVRLPENTNEPHAIRSREQAVRAALAEPLLDALREEGVAFAGERT